jgi:ketosteroid isomerase-like protein
MDQRERRLGILRDVASAFDRHDIDGIMRHIADDAIFDAPRGDERWGTRFVGAEAVREAFLGRFRGIPDVRYTNDEHFVDGDRGASEWTLTGTGTDGSRFDIRGCDLWVFRDDKIVRKDSFWKIRTIPTA